MPNGISNNLHLHFTAEVFVNLGGEFRLRWGIDGKQGEYVSTDGDIISIPTWIFRGFTNEGPDDGILWTVLGRDVTGGIIWGPSVLKEAESYGLHLTADNRLIDTVAGDVLPEGVALIKPIQQKYIDELTTYSVEEMRGRVIQPGDRVYSRNALLCASLPGGGAELSLAIGYGMSEDRRQVPSNPRAALVQHGMGARSGGRRHPPPPPRQDAGAAGQVRSLGDHAQRRPGHHRSRSAPPTRSRCRRAPGARSAASRPASPVPASCSSSTPATTASTSSGHPRSWTPPATRTG